MGLRHGKGEVKDFKEADYTVVVSDLHLCEEEPLNVRFPLWKKYKTRQFFFDDQFNDFLHMIHEKSCGQPIELVLNGDIFDFDSVTGLPEAPAYRVSWLERRRGLNPQEAKSLYKIERILDHHPQWVSVLKWFVTKGHKVVFIIGNHDLELHYSEVQKAIISRLELTEDLQGCVRFNEWFYISNGDTLIEHGNQYDPYCVIPDPIHPLVQRFNKVEIRIPFGNLATRYMINGMGFFNPHADTNFIMTAKEYIRIFFRYIVAAQPFLMWTWFWSSIVTLWVSFVNRLASPMRDPLSIEDRVEAIAQKSNATPRMVRELLQLFVPPAASRPLLILRELWLDRAFLILLFFAVSFQVFLFIKSVYDISLFWTFIPLILFLPFFIFYSQSVSSHIAKYKEPNERILSMQSSITKVSRIIYGHTHQARHEMIGPIEHLNCGTWSPAFEDVECEQPIHQKTYVWIQPGRELNQRVAQLLQFEEEGEQEVFPLVGHRSQPS